MASMEMDSFLKNPQKCTLKFFVATQKSEDEFTIVDKSQSAQLLVLSTFKKGRKHLGVGHYVRAVLPSTQSSESTVVLDEKSTLVPCTPFPTAQYEETVAERLQSGKIDTPLEAAADFMPGYTVNSILVKIVKFGHRKKVQTSQVLHVTIKDVHGTKNQMSIWNQKINAVKENTVYRFKFVKVENYPPNESKKFLSTTAKTTITEVNDPDFENVSVVDMTYEGTCVGVSGFYFYNSCPSCWKKIQSISERCASCDKEIDFPEDDYKCELLIQCEDDVETCVTFRRKIDDIVSPSNILQESASDTERRLNEDLEDKRLKIECIQQRENESPIVHSVQLIG